jgi:hypothetical protein
MDTYDCGDQIVATQTTQRPTLARRVASGSLVWVVGWVVRGAASGGSADYVG